MQPPLFPSHGPDYQPVVTLNGWTMPWRTNGDWKEFHLVAEPVIREFAPGMTAHLWGYNGQSPGHTIEAVEGGSTHRSWCKLQQFQLPSSPIGETMDKIVSKLEFLFDRVKSSLPEQKARWIEEALEANERGLALEYILEYRLEFNIPVDNDFREAARYCGDQMRIDVERFLLA